MVSAAKKEIKVRIMTIRFVQKDLKLAVIFEVW